MRDAARVSTCSRKCQGSALVDTAENQAGWCRGSSRRSEHRIRTLMREGPDPTGWRDRHSHRLCRLEDALPASCQVAMAMNVPAQGGGYRIPRSDGRGSGQGADGIAYLACPMALAPQACGDRPSGPDDPAAESPRLIAPSQKQGLNRPETHQDRPVRPCRSR